MSIPLRSFPPAGACALVCVLAATPALAQSPGTPAALEPVFVTASRSPERLIDLVADVTLIDARAIAQSGLTDLPSLLSRQPGVEIVQNGGPGATSGVFLRGANAAQTVVLVDGMRVASASSGATALEAIPLDQIDHIEILRGPASSL